MTLTFLIAGLAAANLALVVPYSSGFDALQLLSYQNQQGLNATQKIGVQMVIFAGTTAIAYPVIGSVLTLVTGNPAFLLISAFPLCLGLLGTIVSHDFSGPSKIVPP